MQSICFATDITNVITFLLFANILTIYFYIFIYVIIIYNDMNSKKTIGERIKSAIKEAGFTQEDAAETLGTTRQSLNNWLSKAIIDPSLISDIESKLEIDLSNVITNDTGDQLRRNKATKPTEDEGLYYIPIAAQAGYALHYQDPMYLNELERLYIPGNPFRGDNFRYFEIEGDSMYPTLKDGMQVIAEKVDPEYWRQISDYYIYIVVTVDQVLAKRLVKIDDDTFAMVSDNEEMYDQQILKIVDTKEIWRVKRKLDWEMPPPRRIELKINNKK